MSYTLNIDEIEAAENLGAPPPEIQSAYSPFLIDLEVIKGATITSCKECINLFALNDRFTIKYTKEIWAKLESKLNG